MNKIDQIVLSRICAIFIYKTGSDQTRIKFWSQVLACKEKELHALVKMTVTLDHKTPGLPVTDETLENMWEIIKGLNSEEIKSLFNEFRQSIK